MSRIWLPTDRPVIPGKEGLYHLALNAWGHGSLAEGFYLANAAYFLPEKEVVEFFRDYPEPVPIHDPDALEEFAARAIAALRRLRREGRRLRPEPNGYLARVKLPWRRLLAVVDALKDEWPEEAPVPHDKAIYTIRNADGIAARVAERYALLAGEAKLPTAEIARGAVTVLRFYKEEILPRVYEWEYVQEILKDPAA